MRLLPHQGSLPPDPSLKRSQVTEKGLGTKATMTTKALGMAMTMVVMTSSTRVEATFMTTTIVFECRQLWNCLGPTPKQPVPNLYSGQPRTQRHFRFPVCMRRAFDRCECLTCVQATHKQEEIRTGRLHAGYRSCQALENTSSYRVVFN